MIRNPTSSQNLEMDHSQMMISAATMMRVTAMVTAIIMRRLPMG